MGEDVYIIISIAADVSRYPVSIGHIRETAPILALTRYRVTAPQDGAAKIIILIVNL
jgi:hypothetical protein